MSNPSIDVTTDYPINREEAANNESLVRWTRLITLLSTMFPNIHSLMLAKNTSTDKMFLEIWAEMRTIYMKVLDSAENVSWETFKHYLEENISSIPYLATEDIVTVMTGANESKASTSRGEANSLSSQLQSTLKRTASEAISILPTLAPIQTGPADAASLDSILERQASAFGGVTSQSHMSEISCSTSIHGQDSTTTYTYPETQGKYYIQLKVFKFADVLTVPQEKLWTKALQVLKFITKSSKHKNITFQDMKFVISDRTEDLITTHTMNLISEVHKHLREHPKAVQSVKRKRFTNW